MKNAETLFAKIVTGIGIVMLVVGMGIEVYGSRIPSGGFYTDPNEGLERIRRISTLMSRGQIMEIAGLGVILCGAIPLGLSATMKRFRERRIVNSN